MVEKHKSEIEEIVKGKNKEIEELNIQLENFKLKNVTLSERLRKYQKEDPDLFEPDNDDPLPVGDYINKKKVLCVRFLWFLTFSAFC